jgi:hypothetical protein
MNRWCDSTYIRSKNAHVHPQRKCPRLVHTMIHIEQKCPRTYPSRAPLTRTFVVHLVASKKHVRYITSATSSARANPQPKCPCATATKASAFTYNDPQLQQCPRTIEPLDLSKVVVHRVVASKMVAAHHIGSCMCCLLWRRERRAIYRRRPKSTTCVVNAFQHTNSLSCQIIPTTCHEQVQNSIQLRCKHPQQFRLPNGGSQMF